MEFVVKILSENYSREFVMQVYPKVKKELFSFKILTKFFLKVKSLEPKSTRLTFQVRQCHFLDLKMDEKI